MDQPEHYGAAEVRDADLRASDAERDRTATELGEHFQAGRLNEAEFDERVTTALRARTRGELATLVADLPGSGQPQLTATQPGDGLPGDGLSGSGLPGTGRRGAPYLLIPALLPLLLAVILTMSWASHSGPRYGPGSWPLLWLWLVVPIAIVRIRRSRGQQGPGRRG
jgi:Domain of unknown function (DUF1707)